MTIGLGLLAFVASQPLTVDEQAAVKRMQNAADSFLNYRRCIAQTPDAFALVDEPAELTTRAVIAFCLNNRLEAQAARALMLGDGLPTADHEQSAKEFFDTETAKDFDFVLAQIISARAIAKMRKRN